MVRHLSARATISLSSSASRLAVRSALPSLFASTASFSSSLLLHSFRRCTLLLPEARGAGYAHVPGTIDEVIATDTSSSSRPIFLPPPLPLARPSPVSNFRSPLRIRGSYASSRLGILDRDRYRSKKFLQGLKKQPDNLIAIRTIRLTEKRMSTSARFHVVLRYERSCSTAIPCSLHYQSREPTDNRASSNRAK